jgi:hypothetical protein
MGLRFRRSWGLLPGVRLNLGLKSGSVSFGVRGLHYTVGNTGQRVTIGLQGTGLYWTQKINSSSGTAQAGHVNQVPGYVQPARPASPRVQVVNQAIQLPGAQTLHPAFTRLNQCPMQPPGAAQSAPAKLTQLFVPVWLVWAALAVIAIAALCFSAAAIGQLLPLT